MRSLVIAMLCLLLTPLLAQEDPEQDPAESREWGWDAVFHAGLGYDSDPLLRGESVSTSQRNDSFGLYGARMGYWSDHGENPLELGLGFGVSGVEQDDFPEADQLDTSLMAYLGWDIGSRTANRIRRTSESCEPYRLVEHDPDCRKLPRQEGEKSGCTEWGQKRGLSLVVRSDLNVLRLGGDAFRDQTRVFPKLTYRWGCGTHRVSAYGAYEFHTDRTEPMLSELDRNGEYSTMGVEYSHVRGVDERRYLFRKPVRPESLSFTVGWGRRREPTEGTEFDRTADVLSAGIRLPLTGGGNVAFEGDLRFSDSEYAAPSIFDSMGRIRKDDTFYAGAGLTFSLRYSPEDARIDDIRLRIGGEYKQQKSNVAVYDFTSHAVLVSVEFLMARKLPSGVDTETTGSKVESGSSSSGPARPRTTMDLMPANP